MVEINISESDYRLARFLKAIGNPVRLSIIRTLIEKSSCPHGCHPSSCDDKCEGENCKCGCKCGELVDMFPISQSTISQHIKELKNAGLIETSGRKGDYVLNHKIFKECIESLSNLARLKDENSFENKECCCNHSSTLG